MIGIGIDFLGTFALFRVEAERLNEVGRFGEVLAHSSKPSPRNT